MTDKILKKKTIKEIDEPKTDLIDKNSVETVIKEAKVTDKLAKAGKRSAKSLKEEEQKVAKETRKKSIKSEESSESLVKKTIKPTRSKLVRRSKKYQTVSKKIDSKMFYPIDEAITTILETSTTKFDSTVELHINLNVDPRQADQNIRDSIVLPSGTGKAIRVAVFAEGKEADAANKAGADIVGTDEIIRLLDKEQIDFDILISTPVLMAKLGKYARLLGPKGLMPNPKSGTVTPDVSKAVVQSKAGKIEFRVDSSGIVHLGIGKVSFGLEKVKANFDAVYSNIKSNKPNSIKGSYIKAIYITTSMGPSVKIDISSL